MNRQDREFRIGRDRECEVVIADESVSRFHAVLSLLEDKSLFLSDCNSTNGTSLIRDGSLIPVSQEFVLPEDEIQFGDIRLSVDEVLAVIRKKHAVPAAREISRPRPPSDENSLPPGRRLIRCGCGSVKVKGELCSNCGS